MRFSKFRQLVCLGFCAAFLLISSPGLTQGQEQATGLSAGADVTDEKANAAAAGGEKSEGAQAVSAETVRKVLRALDADEIQTRDAAERELVAMGPQVLSFLPAINASTSGELKIRLQRIRQSLESKDVETFFEASTVKLVGTFALNDAIQKIQTQTGNEITIQGEDALTGVEVELDADGADFWDVMGEIMSQAKLRVNAFGTTEGDLVLAPGGPGGGDASQPPTFSRGPFRVDAASVQSTLPFNSQIGGQLQISLQVTWEPRLKPVFMQIPMASVEATLGDDRTLAATNPQAAPEIPLNYGGCTTQIDLQLERPARSEEMITRLKGEFVVAVPSENHEYVFEKFGNGARQSETFGDVTVVLEGSRRNGAVYEMRVKVGFGDANGALDSFRGWILSNQAYLRDQRGGRLENVGLQTYGVTNNSVGIAYLFQINGDPNDYKLVYESPASVTKQTVKYEVENIELP